MNITKGVDLLKEYESFAKTKPGNPNLAHAYWDALGGIWTIAWGFTKGVKEGDTMLRAGADNRLERELDEEYVQPILKACKVEPNEHQLGAMACLAWNIGINGFKKSTVLKCYNRGDHNAAARAFALWNKAGGKVVKGLVRRRAAEAALYLTPVEGEEPEPMPQAVDAPKTMQESTINRSAVIAGGTATIAATTQVIDTVNSVKDSVEGLGAWLVPALLIITVLAVGYILYQRFGQRSKGIA